MIRVEKYGQRAFAVYEGDALLAVVCYRKGAEALRSRIDGLRQRVADLEYRLRESEHTTTRSSAKRIGKRPAPSVSAPGGASCSATA